MNIKLIKLSDTHYIIVDDSEIKKGDWYWTPVKRTIEQCVRRLLIIKDGENDKEQFKITHSTEPFVIYKKLGESNNHNIDRELPSHPVPDTSIKPISLSEIKETIYGYSVEKMAKNGNANMKCFEEIWIEGFKAHQELVKDKLFTVENMIDAFREGTNAGALHESLVDYDSHDSEEAEEFSETEFKEFKQSLLPKTEWDIEFVEDKIKLI